MFHNVIQFHLIPHTLCLIPVERVRCLLFILLQDVVFGNADGGDDVGGDVGSNGRDDSAMVEEATLFGALILSDPLPLTALVDFCTEAAVFVVSLCTLSFNPHRSSSPCDRSISKVLSAFGTGSVFIDLSAAINAGVVDLIISLEY